MLGNKAKPRRSNSKGNLNGGNSSNINTSNSNTLLSLSTRSLHLDTVASGFGRALSKSIPVLSIFALMGIITSAIGINVLDDNVKVASAAGADTANASSSLTIDDNTIKDNITAVRNDIAYASHNIKLNASDIASYTLTITGPTNLTTTDSNGNTVSSGTTITGAGNKTPTNMSNNTWGYGWGSANADEASLSYQSFTGSAQTLANGNADSNHNASLENKLVFAAKFSDNAAEGHYKATIGLNLTVTPRALSSLEQISTMQEMTSSICSRATVGDTATLTDTRTGNYTYTVAKLADGNCWMTQNLRLAGGTAMTSSDTDLNGISFYALPAATTGGFSDTQTNGTYENQQVRNSSDNDYGAYYSWCAATAGTCMTNSTTPVPANTDASSSICPRGWKLPKGGSSGDFQALYNKYHSSWTTNNSKNGYWFGAANTASGGAFFPAAGIVNTSGLSGTGSSGGYWSRTAGSATGAYYLYFYSSNVYPVYNFYRYVGYSVRCVAEKPQEYTYSISYKLKDTHSLPSSGTMPSNETITTTDTSHTFTVKPAPAVETSSGRCNIKDWLGSDGVVYTPNSTVTLTPDQPSITLTTNTTGGCVK